MCCFFVSDLHGNMERYKKLFKTVERDKPEAVFFGGDLLPTVSIGFSKSGRVITDFWNDFLLIEFRQLKEKMDSDYPEIFLILGNDDEMRTEQKVMQAESEGLLTYVNNKKAKFKNFNIYGYAYVPPSPFLLKDWEKYDVSRYVDPGSVSPEEGVRSVQIAPNIIRYATIQKDLQILAGDSDLSASVFLFHAPPYKTNLDRAALDGKTVDYVPLDLHVGSIAIRRFIEQKQPLLTLHGHIHESASITGFWKDQLGKTINLSAAHAGPELCLVRFDPQDALYATRELI